MDRRFKTRQEVLEWWWRFPLDAPVTKATELDAKRLEALWDKLSGEAGLEAYQALAAVAASGDRAADFIAARVKPVTIEAGRIKALVADLDSDKYAVRRKAFAELSRIGRPAGPALQEALKAKPSAEVRTRAEQLIAALAKPYPATPEARRTARAVRILELIATPRAMKVLQALAKGDPPARATTRAKAALLRIGKKKGR